MSGGRTRRLVALAVFLGIGSGCSLAPKAFRSRDLNDPAPLVRARAATMGDRMPATVVVPALLDRLDDPDPVVRLTAHEELKRRTGQDFAYHPWDDRAERAQAIARWRAWWTRQAPAQPTPQQPVRRTRAVRPRFRFRIPDAGFQMPNG